MSDCTIYRRLSGGFSASRDGKIRWGRNWRARCPICRAEDVTLIGHDRRTRKTAKDALYRHMLNNHKPGLAGR